MSVFKQTSAFFCQECKQFYRCCRSRTKKQVRACVRDTECAANNELMMLSHLWLSVTPESYCTSWTQPSWVREEITQNLFFRQSQPKILKYMPLPSLSGQSLSPLHLSGLGLGRVFCPKEQRALKVAWTQCAVGEPAAPGLTASSQARLSGCLARVCFPLLGWVFTSAL